MQWWPRLEGFNREARWFGVAVPGGVDHVGMRARALHDPGNRFVLTDRSNAFNPVNRTAVLEETANCVLALTPFILANCYGARPGGALSRTDSGETRTVAFAPAGSRSSGTLWGRRRSASRCDRG